MESWLLLKGDQNQILVKIFNFLMFRQLWTGQGFVRCRGLDVLFENTPVCSVTQMLISSFATPPIRNSVYLNKNLGKTGPIHYVIIVGHVR